MKRATREVESTARAIEHTLLEALVEADGEMIEARQAVDARTVEGSSTPSRGADVDFELADLRNTCEAQLRLAEEASEREREVQVLLGGVAEAGRCLCFCFLLDKAIRDCAWYGGSHCEEQRPGSAH